MAGQTENWKGILLLSMIVPIGLFTTIRLTGLGQPIVVPAVVKFSDVYWQLNRTGTGFVPINRELNTTFEDACLMTFSTILGQYAYEHFQPYYFVDLAVAFNVSPTSGDFRLMDVRITFSNTLGNSEATVQPPQFEIRNLALVDYTYGGEAHIYLVPSNSSANAAFRDTVYWNIYTLNSVTEQLEVDFQMTYYNGTAYKAAIQPFILTLIGE